jgi:hypothetical protein
LSAPSAPPHMCRCLSSSLNIMDSPEQVRALSSSKSTTWACMSASRRMLLDLVVGHCWVAVMVEISNACSMLAATSYKESSTSSSSPAASSPPVVGHAHHLPQAANGRTRTKP